MELALRISPDTPPGEFACLVKHALEGFARGYVPTFRRLGLPPLYQSGIVFRRDPQQGSGVERFAVPADSLQSGWVDCDRAVWYRLCELYAAGQNPTCRAEWVGPALHVLVRHANGKTEDPMQHLIDLEQNPL